MDVTGDYENSGYLHVRELIPPEVARAILRSIKEGLGPDPLELSCVTHHQAQLKRPARYLRAQARRIICPGRPRN